MEAQLLRFIRVIILLIILALLASPAQFAFGKPEEDDSNVIYTGTWVSLEFNETSGEISDLVWNETLLFTNISFDKFTLQKTDTKKDSFNAQAFEIIIEIIDSEEVTCNFNAKKDIEISFKLPDDAVISSIDDQTKFIDWTDTNGTLSIDASGAWTTEDSFINSSLTKGRSIEVVINTTASPDDASQKDANKVDKKDKPDKKPTDIIFGTFSGKYLDFEYNLTAEILKNVSIYDIGLFSQLTMENGSFSKEKVSNHLFKGDGAGAKLIAHDNPLALIQIKARDSITIHLNVTDNWEIIETEPNITLQSEDINVSLRLLGKPSEDTFVINDLDLSIYLHKSSKLHINIINVSMKKNKEEIPGILWFSQSMPVIMQAIDGEYFGGDATIIGSSGAPQVEMNTYIEDFGLNVNNVKSETKEISMLMSSQDPAGKMVLVSALKETLGYSVNSKVQVLMDGKPINNVDTTRELNINSVGYYRISDSEGEQLIISVPQFSEHTITIKFIPEIDGITPTIDDLKEKVWTHWDALAIVVILIIISIAGLHLYLVRRE